MAKNMFEEALAGIGAAISDVREKVVEEGYFGRAVSPQGGQEQEAAPAGGGNAFEQAVGSSLTQTEVPDKSRDTPEPGGGMDI